MLIGGAFAVNAPLAQQPGDDRAAAQDDRSLPAIREAVYSRLAEAQSCFQTQDFACARARLDDVAALDLNTYETAQYWSFLALIQSTEGDTAGATVSYEQLLRLSDLPAGLRMDALRGLVRLYRDAEQYPQAFEALDELYELQGEAPLSRPSSDVAASGDFLPIAKVRPAYPPEAASQRLEGHVIVEYTVTEAGLVTDPAVVESSSEIFEGPVLEAAEQYKYRPMIEGGESVAVNGVRSVIRFELDE